MLLAVAAGILGFRLGKRTQRRIATKNNPTRDSTSKRKSLDEDQADLAFLNELRYEDAAGLATGERSVV